jgi:2-polyprenyl-3-methyl-5-hydroxy-6-metoxy-1,4-benzoquinol methylase
MSSPSESQEFLQRRIESERLYHDEHYRNLAVPIAVETDLATSQERRPHNLTWTYYDTIRACFGGNVAGKKILAIGCGAGLVSLNLAYQGAEIDAFDLSREAVALCRSRAEYLGLTHVKFMVSSFEDLDRPENSYDAVVGEMVLHHIDIPTAAERIFRLLKPGGHGVFSEWKAYAVVDAIRSRLLFRRWFPPGGVDGYATEYERKLTDGDFQIIRTRFPDLTLEVRYCLCGKVGYFAPRLASRLEKLDYRLLRSLSWLRPFTDGVVLHFTKR